MPPDRSYPDEANYASDRLFAQESRELQPLGVIARLEAAIEREYAKPYPQQRQNLIKKWRLEMVHYGGFRSDRERTKR